MFFLKTWSTKEPGQGSPPELIIFFTTIPQGEKESRLTVLSFTMKAFSSSARVSVNSTLTSESLAAACYTPGEALLTKLKWWRWKDITSCFALKYNNTFLFLVVIVIYIIVVHVFLYPFLLTYFCSSDQIIAYHQITSSNNILQLDHQCSVWIKSWHLSVGIMGLFVLLIHFLIMIKVKQYLWWIWGWLAFVVSFPTMPFSNFFNSYLEISHNFQII